MTATATREREFSSSSTVPPAWATQRNPLRPTYGAAVVAAAAILGKPLMPWQVHVVMVALEVQSEAAGDPNPGDWAYDEVGVSVQRQAGKTYLLRPVLVHRMRSIPAARLWSTAQTGVHARRRWLDATDALMASPVAGEFRRKTGAAHEEMRMRSNNSTLEPFAPNGDSLHGETPDLVLVDELWAYDAEEARELEQAYLPGFTTKDGQAWLLSTAGTAASAWLNALRRRGRRAVEDGTQLGLAWFEWQLPDVVDGVPVEELDDEALVEACIRFHPANGYTLRPASIRSAWSKMTERDYAVGRAEFLRAYGNRTTGTGRPRLIDANTWARAKTTLTTPEGARLSLGVEVDPDGLEASLVVGCRLPDGRGLVDVIERRDGVTWAAGRTLEVLANNPDVARQVAVNDSGPSRELADLLELAGVEVFRIHASDFAAACVRFDRELREKSRALVLHRGQLALDTAAEAVQKRKLGGSWAWLRPDDVPITAIVAATVALWGIDHSPADEPEPDFVIG